MDRELAYGLNSAVPATATVAWGARLIFPDDLLYDRQDFVNPKTAKGEKLLQWLNGGALKKALSNARTCGLSQKEDKTITLYEDPIGVIKGNPRMSHGYLYVAAFLKEEE